MGALGSVDDCQQVITNPRWRFSETLQLQLQKRLIINAFPAQNVKDSYFEDTISCKAVKLVKILMIHYPRTQVPFMFVFQQFAPW